MNEVLRGRKKSTYIKITFLFITASPPIEKYEDRNKIVDSRLFKKEKKKKEKNKIL
jgi:hypothetical protein